MKRTITTLLLVLLCLTPITTRYLIQETYGAECEDSCSDPVQLARMSPAVLGASSGVVCVAKTMGYVNTGGTSTQTVDAGSVYSQGVTAPTFSAPCTGALKSVYIINKDTRTDNTIKVCVYVDGTTVGTPDASDTLVACSGTITGTATNPETQTAVFSSGTVSSGGTYRIVVANDNNSGGGYSINYYADTADMESGTECTTFFDSPPSDLSACTWGSNANRRLDVYVTVE